MGLREILRSSRQSVQTGVHAVRERVTTSPYQSSIDHDIETALVRYAADQGVGPSAADAEDRIVELVKSVGYVILPSAISADVLTGMRSEFRAIIDADNGDFYAVDRHDGGVCVRMRPFLKTDHSRQYPAIYAFFNSDAFRSITRKFYADSQKGVDYVTAIFVHETPETGEPLSGKLHWDRAQTLKIWIYIDDLPEQAGPMLIEPHSAARNRKVRIAEHSEKGTLVGGVDNVVDVTSHDTIALAAPAGSVMIFDTDASHGASPVMPGHVRRIIRGQSQAKS